MVRLDGWAQVVLPAGRVKVAPLVQRAFQVGQVFRDSLVQVDGLAVSDLLGILVRLVFRDIPGDLDKLV
jgi:hypothetical protein